MITTWRGEPALSGGRIVAAGDPGSTSRPSEYCRKSARRHRIDPQIGIERRPEQTPGLIGFLQDLVVCLRNQNTGATFSRTANSSMACVETMVSVPAANSSREHATLKG